MPEKLTTSITVKLSPELLRRVKLRAEQLGFLPPEYMRNLLDNDLGEAKRQFEALSAIFSDGQPDVQENDGSLG